MNDTVLKAGYLFLVRTLDECTCSSVIKLMPNIKIPLFFSLLQLHSSLQKELKNNLVCIICRNT